VSGADQRIPLAPATPPLPPDVAARFRFVGAGARLALPPAARAQLADLLRGEVLLVREDDQGRVVAATRLQVPGALDARYAAARNAPDLGATPLAGGTPAERTAFALWAPTARRASVCVYADARGAATHQRPLRPDPATGIWRDTVAGVGHGRAYRFLVDVVVPGAGVVRNRVTDPYSLGLTANSGAQRGARPAAPVHEARRVGRRRAPGGARRAHRSHRVRAPRARLLGGRHHRAGAVAGKFLAFTEPASDGMRHLRALAAPGSPTSTCSPSTTSRRCPRSGASSPRSPGPRPTRRRSRRR
jgi:hypothetical protein